MERTIWTNRLIDGAKIDAISLNWWNMINATSIWSWTITDAEFDALNGITWNIQDLIDNVVETPLNTETPKITTDVKFTYWTPSFDWTCVVLTSWDKITRYCPTSQQVLMNGELVAVIPMNGTYNAWTWDMVYDNGLTINSTTWDVLIWGQTIAYETSSNTFNADTIQTFKGWAIFEWQVALPFADIWTQTGDFNFVWTSWMNQKVTMNKTGWTQTVNFSKMAPWNYELFVVQTWTATLSLWTVTDSWTINDTSIIWSTIFPLTLTTGSHILVLSVANVKVHVWYVGKSE